MAAVVTQVDLNITFIHILPVLLCTVSSSVHSSCITFSCYKIWISLLVTTLEIVRAGVISIVLSVSIQNSVLCLLWFISYYHKTEKFCRAMCCFV